MIRVIIVDDEILSRIGIQTFLTKEEDIRVAGVFADAPEALEFLRENTVDIVITDIEMSEMDGLEFIRIVRKENLADGIIILSCHDNFNYAQEAIAMGTDSYLLKHSITEEKINQEVRRVYEKKCAGSRPSGRAESSSAKKSVPEDGIYRIGILKIKNTAERPETEQMDTAMLANLLDGIVSRFQIGTLFAPYDREIFVIFRFEKQSGEGERWEILEDNISLIEDNMKPYISNPVLFGISPEFTDLRQTREKYKEALIAVGFSFYEPDRNVFFYQAGTQGEPEPCFEVRDFYRDGWLDVFAAELSRFFGGAYFKKLPVEHTRELLFHGVSSMFYQIMNSCSCSQDFRRKWNTSLFWNVIQDSTDVPKLKSRLTEAIGQFRGELLADLAQDDLSGILDYISENLIQKLTLTELAQKSCMSVPSFCKKFKDRTGMTVVQYLNERRIGLAKRLLQNQNYSLEQVAEMTGFSNANYLVRVFKKQTGQTVSEYRRKYGIQENG